MKFQPCYNYYCFHNTGSLMFNDEFADMLANCIRSSKLKHPVLDALAVDLMDGESDLEEDIHTSNPSYDYGHYQQKGHLMFNKALAFLMSDAISNSQSEDKPIPPALWALHYKLRGFSTEVPTKTLTE